jgi:hypothetical protein
MLSRSHKSVDRKLVEPVDAFDLCASNLEQHIAVFDRLLRFTSSERVLQSIEGRPAGEWPFLKPRVDTDTSLEKQIMPQRLRLVAVRLLSGLFQDESPGVSTALPTHSFRAEPFFQQRSSDIR